MNTKREKLRLGRMVYATDIKTKGMDFDKPSTGLQQGNSWETNSARDDRRFINEIKKPTGTRKLTSHTHP